MADPSFKGGYRVCPVLGVLPGRDFRE